MNSKIFFGLVTVIAIALLGFGIYRFMQTMRPGVAPTNKAISLLDYNTPKAQVRLSIEGPVVADELHKQVIITISQSQRTLETKQTYGQDTVESQSYPNNPAAFEDFIHALQAAGFTKSTRNTSQPDRGACPTGQRYFYELISDDKTIQKLWSTSCGTSGTFNGSGSSIRQLFQAQIPNYTGLQNTVEFQLR